MLKDNTYTEKRAYPRVPLHIPLKFRLLEGPNEISSISDLRKREVKSTAIDASLGGMFIKSEQDLIVGGVMALNFSLPEISGELSAFAEVVWTNSSGVGVHFLALKPEDMKTLDAVLAKVSLNVN